MTISWNYDTSHPVYVADPIRGTNFHSNKRVCVRKAIATVHVCIVQWNSNLPNQDLETSLYSGHVLWSIIW